MSKYGMFLSLTIAFQLMSLYKVSYAADIVVDISEAPVSHHAVALDVISLRPIFENFNSSQEWANTFGIPKNVIVKSAIAFPALRRQFEVAKATSEYSWNDIGHVYSYFNTPSGEALLQAIGTNSTAYLVENGIVDPGYTIGAQQHSSEQVNWDPVSVVSLTANQVVNLNSKNSDAATPSTSGDFVPIHTQYKAPFRGAFWRINLAWRSDQWRQLQRASISR